MILLLKIFVSISIVVLLSLIAEHVSPKAAGLLSGYPLGSAIALFFYGLEISAEFAAQSAIYTMLGLIASQSFVYCYFRASLYSSGSILFSSLCAIGGYLVVAWGLHFVHVPHYAVIAITITSVLGFSYLFRQIPNVQIRQKMQVTWTVLLIRAILATIVILFVTGIARLVGSTWAGLFSVFPMTLFPLILIVHFSYGSEHVHTIIKNFPIGLGSLIIYSLAVSIVYPCYGIYLGTLISLVMATIYLLSYQAIATRRQAKVLA